MSSDPQPRREYKVLVRGVRMSRELRAELAAEEALMPYCAERHPVSGIQCGRKAGHEFRGLKECRAVYGPETGWCEVYWLGRPLPKVKRARR